MKDPQLTEEVKYGARVGPLGRLLLATAMLGVMVGPVGWVVGNRDGEVRALETTKYPLQER